MEAIVNCCEIQVWQRFLMVWSEREASMAWPEFVLSVAPTAKEFHQTSTSLNDTNNQLVQEYRDF